MRENDQTLKQKYRTMKEVRVRFCVGARWLAAREMWTVAKQRLSNPSNKELVNDLQLQNNSAATQLGNGQAGFELYVCALVSAGLHWLDLGHLPPKKELAYEGYKASHFAYKNGYTLPLKRKGEKFIDEPTIRTVLLAAGSKEYQKCLRLRNGREDFDSEDWADIARSIGNRLADAEMDRIGGERLQVLFAEHAEPIIACCRAIKYRWTKLPEEEISAEEDA